MAGLSDAEKAALRTRLADRPGDFVGQEVVRLSTMPVLASCSPNADAVAPAPQTAAIMLRVTRFAVRAITGVSPLGA